MNRFQQKLAMFYEKLFKRKLAKQRELSPKGACFRAYCREVIEGTESTIENYEKMLEKLRGTMRSMDGGEVTRKDAARCFYELTAPMSVGDR